MYRMCSLTKQFVPILGKKSAIATNCGVQLTKCHNSLKWFAISSVFSMDRGGLPVDKFGRGRPLYSNFFKNDFVNAKASVSRRNSGVQDASGFRDKTSSTESTATGRSLPVALVPLSIPTRKGSFFLNTPNSPESRVYAMNGSKRGKVLIFNQVEFDVEGCGKRIGTNRDVERLYSTLPLLGFQQNDIKLFEDCSVAEIWREAEKLQDDEDLEEADCLVVVILTHGGEGDYLMAKDDRYHLYKFIENFTPTALKSMAGKPKLFIVQACRGHKLDPGVILRAKSIQSDSMPKDVVDAQYIFFKHPVFADLMIVMSSHHGHVSFRLKTGSWLIQELCNEIEGCNLEKQSFYEILTETNNRVAQRTLIVDGKLYNEKQITSFYSTFTKQLFFPKVANVTCQMSDMLNNC